MSRFHSKKHKLRAGILVYPNTNNLPLQVVYGMTEACFIACTAMGQSLEEVKSRKEHKLFPVPGTTVCLIR